MAVIPGTATPTHWALLSRAAVARANTWLAGAVGLHTIGTSPTMFGITLALARASVRVQRASVGTLSHTLAGRSIPSLHWGIFIDAAITVFHCLPEHLGSLTELSKIYVCQELPYGHEREAVGTATCCKVASSQPSIDCLLRDFASAYLVLKRRVASQSHTRRPRRFRRPSAVVTLVGLATQVYSHGIHPPELQTKARISARARRL